MTSMCDPVWPGAQPSFLGSVNRAEERCPVVSSRAFGGLREVCQRTREISKKLKPKPINNARADKLEVRVSVLRIATGDGPATNLALILHELATNSVKCGSLSVGAGTVDITCKVQENEVTLVRTEHGGPPPVYKPAEVGFGSNLVNRVVAQLGGSFPPGGRLRAL
jgi:hypothetical protein